MTPEHWQQVKEVLNAALGRDPGERAAFISKACGGDESLRHEVESLIISHGEAGSFIEEPAFNVNAEMLADEQAEFPAGRSFGPYEILSKLGAGGMGDVPPATNLFQFLSQSGHAQALLPRQHVASINDALQLSTIAQTAGSAGDDF